MRSITIGRYPEQQATPARQVDYAGYIEGVDDDGNAWIMYLDGRGRPASYWGTRGEDGAVEGEPIRLA